MAGAPTRRRSGIGGYRTSGHRWPGLDPSCPVSAALLLARLAANTSWIIGAVIALAALALALAAVRVSARRYRQAASALSADEPLPDGTLPAIIVALVLLIGGAAVVFILVEL